MKVNQTNWLKIKVKGKENVRNIDLVDVVYEDVSLIINVTISVNGGIAISFVKVRHIEGERTITTKAV